MLRLAQKAFLPSADSLPATAHRYRLQVCRDACLSRRDGAKVARVAGVATSRRLPRETKPLCSTPNAAAACSRRRRCWMRCAITTSMLLRRCTARRREVAGKGAYLLLPRCAGQWTRRISGPSSGTFTTRAFIRRKHSCISHFQLDGDGTFGSTSTRKKFRWSISTLQGTPSICVETLCCPRSKLCCASRREAADGQEPAALAWLQPLHRRHPLRSDSIPDHCGADLV